MEIIIEETGKIEELVIIDNNSGCEYTADLIEAGHLPCNADGVPILTQEDYNNWIIYTLALSKAEEALSRLINDLEYCSVSPADLKLDGASYDSSYGGVSNWLHCETDCLEDPNRLLDACERIRADYL